MAATQFNEQQLIVFLQKGDKQAVTMIFHRYGKALLGVIFQIVRDEKIAEDVLQESLVKIWKNGPRYDKSKGRLFTWLLNICRNSAIDKIRSKGYRQNAKIQSTNNFVPITASMAEYELRTDHIGLKEIVERLEPKYRTLINLVYFGGRTQSEASKELDLPLGTVKTRLRTAIGILQTWMKV